MPGEVEIKDLPLTLSFKDSDNLIGRDSSDDTDKRITGLQVKNYINSYEKVEVNTKLDEKIDKSSLAIQSIDLEMKIFIESTSSYDRDDGRNYGRLRIFSKLRDDQAEYIADNMDNIQLWMMRLAKYWSSHGNKKKWKHQNNVRPEFIKSQNELTKNIVTEKLFPESVYIYGGENNNNSGYGIGVARFKDMYDVNTDHSETDGFVPTEFKILPENIVTLLDGSKALQIDIDLRHFRDNVAAEVESELYGRFIKMMGVQSRSCAYNGYFDYMPTPKVAIKFMLTELKNDRKIDGKMTNSSLLLSVQRLPSSPRAIGFSIIG